MSDTVGWTVAGAVLTTTSPVLGGGALTGTALGEPVARAAGAELPKTSSALGGSLAGTVLGTAAEGGG